MTRDEFLKLNRDFRELPPDLSIRVEYMENRFSEVGISKENGYKAVQYFYTELCNAKEGKPTSVFEGQVFLEDGLFGIVGQHHCLLKMKIVDFDKRKEIYFAPQQTKTQQEIPTFKNNFDKITPVEIYEHFRAGLVEKGYLTEQELNEYLKTAFELKTIPETLFKIKDAPKKATIEAIFYKYYKNVAGKIHGTQNQYAALLGDYFEGYKTATVSSNFSKSVY